jgi:hypothetical protein
LKIAGNQSSLRIGANLMFMKNHSGSDDDVSA